MGYLALTGGMYLGGSHQLRQNGELEAELITLCLLDGAGYDPGQASDFLLRLATHKR